MATILIMGSGDVPPTVHVMKAGAVDFLTKPFGEDVRLSPIDEAIEPSHATLGQELAGHRKAARTFGDAGASEHPTC